MLTLRRLVIVAALVGCRGDRPTEVERREAPPRRVIDPPRTDVRALPPHAITADGVGPYKLGMTMAQIVAAVPSGPRIALMQIPGVVDHSLVRDAGISIGGERQGDASFISVERVAVARTADGVGVGTSRDALTAALGPAEVDDRIARDPTLWVGRGLPGTRFVMFDDRVGALVVMPRPAPLLPAAPEPGCARTVAAEDAVPATAQGACLEGADAVAAVGAQVMVYDGKGRKLAGIDVPGLRWVAPLRGQSGRDELVAASQLNDDDGRRYGVTVLGFEAGRLVRLAEVEAYRLTETSAAWIGARLDDLDLRLEFVRSGDELRIGGLLVHRGTSAVVDAAPLLPVTVRVTRRAPEDRDRPRQDAGPAEIDGAVDTPP
ncbi:MAG: hypothetical protein R3B06_28900 [Kofleriaceae bacterium]